MEIPDGVVALTIGPTFDLIAPLGEELVDGERGVGVVGGDEVGHRPTGDAESAANWIGKYQ